MNLRFAHVQKSLSSAPVQSCCPQRALFQVYISYSMQKGQASSCKMYTRGEIFMEISRFLVKLQAFCRILTKPEASAIFFTDSGTKPGVRTEARVLHPDGAFYPPLRLRSGAAQSPQGAFAFCHLIFAAIDTTKGSAVGL
ncbi:hypothetical protein [Faecalibacterium prausnitzii]|jgi:hypothetical protein|uniref:hypothetical protein n=1 Tax=Faecalibacterium TaxID=216851 RepID=UPI0032EB8CA7